MSTPRALILPRILIFTTLLLVLLPAALVAQTTAARPDRGIMPGASYSVSDFENISLTNGNVQLTIPLASLPPMAGGKLKFTVNAVYNSKLWNVTRQEQRLGQFYGCPSWVVDTPQLSDLGGWRIPYNYQFVFRNAHEDFDYDTPAAPPTADCETDVQEQTRLQSQYYRVILITPDGAEHELRPTDNYAPYGGSRSYLLNYFKDTPNTINGAMRYYSFDGSYLYAVINPSGSATSWTVYMKDGTRIVQYSNGIQRITDTNGNNIKIFTDANGGHVQDELTGREIKITDTSVSYQTVTGIWQSISLVRGTTQVQGKIYQVNDWNDTGGETGGGSVCTRNDLLATSVPVIREIVFPATEPGVSARRYSFSYNSDTTSSATDDWHLACGTPLQPYTRTVSNGMGELSEMTTPSGAVVKYSYSKSSINNFSFDINDIPRATVTQKQIVHDGITDTWNYNIIEFAACGGTVTAPDGSVTIEQCYPHDPAWAQFFGFSTDKGGLSLRSRRSDKEVLERHWIMLPFTGANSNATGNFGGVAFNPVVDAEYLTVLDDTPSHSPVKMSAKKYQYDFNGNLTQEIDYDWFDPGLVTRDSDGIPVSIPAGATALRTTNYSHYNQAATAGSANVYAKRSLTTATPLILSAPQQTTLGSSIVQFSYDGQSYGVAPTVGNLTSKRVWDDLDSKWITTSSTYDVYGNGATSTDGRGKTTQYFYDDCTHALPTRVVIDPQNGTGTQTTTTVYDYATGLVTSITDPNNATTTTDYTNQLLGTIDPFARPGVIIGPLVNAGGVNQHHRVTTNYEDHLLRVVVAADLNTENDKLIKTRTTTDMLGRTVLTEQTEDGVNYTFYSQQAYAQAGRISFSSSVMRSGSSSNTDSWTRVTNDVLGRPIEVTTFGGATQPPNTGTTATATGTITTAYSANFTTVTDQAGKIRRSMVDGLGRLLRVDEPDASNNLGSTTAPVQPTSYAYDVFGNLTTVTQGSQTRSFTYDSLSRLHTALNPESGSVSYQYDDTSNLVVKTDARGVSTHFEYDSLNRATRRWYNGSSLVASTTHNNPAVLSSVGATDEVKFYYETQTLPVGAPSYTRGAAVGRLVAQTYGAGTNGDYYAYDPSGRVTLKFQQTGAINYQMSAAYNLSGALTGVTYPSGHSITNAFDQAGRLTTFSGNLGDSTTRTYASGILYSPTGGLVKEQFGTTPAPLYQKLSYNSRGQLAEIRVSTSYTGPTDLDWNRGKIINSYSDQCLGACSGSGMTDNNGNLKKQEIYVPDPISGDTMRSQQFDYDSLNRLNSVREVLNNAEQWKQQFTYDRWGNRTINTGVTYGTGINNKAFTVDTSNNRLGVPAGQSGAMSYDAVGNLTNDTYTGAGNRTYDAENKIVSAWGGNNQAQLYGYDAGGQRIKRTVDGVTTWQIYGIGGELLAEYASNGTAATPQKEYGYRNGQLLISAESGTALAPPVFADDFNDNSLNPTNWTAYGPGSPAVSEQSQQLQITLAPNTAGYNGVYSNSTYNLTGKMVQLESAQAVSQAGWCENFLEVELDANNYFMIQVGAGNMLFRSRVNGVNDQTSIAFDGTANRYWRIRHDQNANLIYFETSADNSVWLTRKTVTPGFALTALRFDLLAGAYGTGNSSPGAAKYDNFKLLASTGSSSLTIPNGGFESPVLGTGNWQYSPTGGSWSFANGGGISGINSAFTGTPSAAPEGVQVAFIQAYGTISQSISGFQSNTNYVITFKAIQRTNCCNTGGQDIGVYVDDVLVGSFHPSASTYVEYSTPAFSASTGAHTVKFAGLNLLGGDQSAFIDNVRITGSPKPGYGVQWLVSDHLGTPRMVFDESGALANVKRHDYLPFGEELLAPTGGRNTAQGYSASDGIRPQFTQKERDIETGLDYFLARYYSSTQGRFTSPDEFKGGPRDLWVLGSGHPEKQALVYADVTNPQSLDKYQYAFNNPLRYVDPDGQNPQDGYELQLRRDEKKLLEGKMTPAEFQARQKARGVGAAAAGAVVMAAIYGPAVAEAVLAWLEQNKDKVDQIVQGSTDAAGGPPGLTLLPDSRLTAAEIDTGDRLAKMLGTPLLESAHLGEEYIVAGTTKTIDAMGQPNAYVFWNEKQFLGQIVEHLRKSVDYIAIDLKSASASQIADITAYVKSLPKEQQARIMYVQ